MTPTPVGAEGDAGPAEGAGHRDVGALGQGLQLADFGGDFHSPIMCTDAQRSNEIACMLAECADVALRAHSRRMARSSKTESVAEYRRQIAAYLQAVAMTTRWKNVEMGQRAGGVAHTTIGRALKGENTMGFPALLALELASGVPIPDSLRGAAIAAQQPAISERVDLETKIRDVARALTKEEKAALFEELRREVAKAG